MLFIFPEYKPLKLKISFQIINLTSFFTLQVKLAGRKTTQNPAPHGTIKQFIYLNLSAISLDHLGAQLSSQPAIQLPCCHEDGKKI